MKKEFHIHLQDGTVLVKDMNPILDLLRKQNPTLPLFVKATDPIIVNLCNSICCGFFTTDPEDPIQHFIAPSQIKSIDIIFEQTTLQKA